MMLLWILHNQDWMDGSGSYVRLMRLYILKLHILEYMNICELLLSAFGIWHVESEDAKNRPLCFLTSEFLASITVSPHIRRKHQIDDEHQKSCAIVPPVTSCKSGCNISLVLKVHTALEILQAF